MREHVINAIQWHDGSMNNGIRGLLAGFGAWKLGSGWLGTVVIFVILYALLGHC